MPGRERWVRAGLTDSLSLSLDLPHDITRQIAQYLTPEYAAALLGSLRIAPPSSSTIDIFAPLEQHFRSFEGRKYLSHMTNTDQRRCLAPEYIFIAEDACGITALLMSDGAIPQIDATAGVWWKALAAPKSGTLTLHNDVSSPFTARQL